MIVGHFFLAFSLVGLFALYRGWEKDKCLKMALAAGMFALLPDIDIIYAWKEILTLFTTGFYGFTDSFWAASQSVHRGVTHSLIALLSAVAAFTVYHKTSSKYLAAGITSLAGITGFLTQSILTAVILALFMATGFYITYRLDSISLSEFSLVSGIGLLLHPFGDLFTGTPPQLLYPSSLSFIEERLVFFTDPVLNLFAVYGIELSLVWVSVLVYSNIAERSIKLNLNRFSILGLAYIFLAGIIRQPTLSTSYQFVSSVIITGLAVVFILRKVEEDKNYFSWIVNFVAVMSLSSAVYLIYYLA